MESGRNSSDVSVSETDLHASNEAASRREKSGTRTGTVDESLKRANARWKNRRWMAWVSMVSLVCVGTASIVFPDRVNEANGVLMTIVMAFTGIVSGYTGWSTYEDVKSGSR